MKNDIDRNGQPLIKAFCYKANRRKAIYTLKGILLGVVADKELNRDEAIFLDMWLRSQLELENDGDTVDLLDAVRHLIEKGKVNSKYLDDTISLINDVIEFKDLGESSEIDCVNELLGLLVGIASDDVINESEILKLKEWLQINDHVKNIWPATVVIKKIKDILEDHVITKEECKEMLELVKEVTGFHMG